MGRLRAASCRARAASLKMSIMFLMKRKPQKNHCKSLVLIPIISDYWSNTHIYIYIHTINIYIYIYKYYIYIYYIYIPLYSHHISFRSIRLLVVYPMKSSTPRHCRATRCAFCRKRRFLAWLRGYLKWVC